MEPIDLDRLRDIPDPYAAPARAPRRNDRAPALTGAPSPTRAAMRTARGGALVVAFVYEALWLALFPQHGEPGAASRAGVGVALGVPALACAVAFAGAVRRGGLGLGPPGAAPRGAGRAVARRVRAGHDAQRSRPT